MTECWQTKQDWHGKQRQNTALKPHAAAEAGKGGGGGAWAGCFLAPLLDCSVEDRLRDFAVLWKLWLRHRRGYLLSLPRPPHLVSSGPGRPRGAACGPRHGVPAGLGLAWLSLGFVIVYAWQPRQPWSWPGCLSPAQGHNDCSVRQQFRT